VLLDLGLTGVENVVVMNKASQVESSHSRDDSHIIDIIERQAAKRLRRSAAKALLDFMNSQYHGYGNKRGKV